MQALFLPKYHVDNETLIERSLPCEGSIQTKKGLIVQAFDKVGEGRFLLGDNIFSFSGELVKKRGDFVSQGELIAKPNSKAPTTGYLVKIDKEKMEITIRKPSRPFDLICGVPGFVANVLPNKGVVITTRAVIAKGVASVGGEVGGELVVIGKGNDSLKQENFEGELADKIVVCGHLTKETYAKGRAVGVNGFICGSTNYSTFTNFKSDSPAVIVMEGFGEIPLSPILFAYLKNIQARFVVIRAPENELLIPESEHQKWCHSTVSYFTELAVGNLVQIFTYPSYGFFGKVDSFDEKKREVTVSLIDRKETVTVPVESVGVVS